mgnify:CR=1 FL=1
MSDTNDTPSDDSIKPPHTFDFYYQRFWFAVDGWSNDEIVAYLRLLSHQWDRGDSLPADLGELAQMGRIDKLPTRIAEKFPLDGPRRTRRNKFQSKNLTDTIDRLQRARAKSLHANSVKKAKARAVKVGEPKAGGFPPTVEMVIAEAAKKMAPKECAMKWHGEMEGVGWVVRGSPIRKWQPVFWGYCESWKANEARSRQNDKHRTPTPKNDTKNTHGRYAQD